VVWVFCHYRLVQITADAVVQLIVHYIELKGPQPIGELGKLLQDATGNPGTTQLAV